MSERRRVSLAQPSAVLSGVGLHSGADASLRLLPAPVGSGLVFRRRSDGQEIKALAANVSDTSRCTRLRSGDFEVQTVEHLLSALAGHGIDDVIIEIDGPEVPAADGSAAPFVELAGALGLYVQDEPLYPFVLTQPVFLSEGGSTLIALPAERFSVSVVLDYPDHAYLGASAAVYDSVEWERDNDYDSEIAPARTFGFLSEIEALRARGLGLGASFDNAVVLGETRYETPLRFPNELARHKILDLIGDLALVGRPVQARIIAVKPGHAINVRLARRLSETISENVRQGAF